MPGTVTVRYFAGARAAAGIDEETVPLPPAATFVALAAELALRHPALEKVLGRCSYLCDSLAVRDPAAALPAGAVIDVLPPFAGG